MARAWCVQSLRAIHQCALDRGSWQTASLLWPSADPLQGDDFGGTPEELLAAHAWHTAMKDMKQGRPAKGGEEESEEQPAGGGGAAGNKKK